MSDCPKSKDIRDSEQHENMNTICKEYLELKYLSQAYQKTLGIAFGITYNSGLIMTIFFVYLVFNCKGLSVFLIGPIVAAIICYITSQSILLTIVTESHLFSKELISDSKQICRVRLPYFQKFWRGMKPLKISVGSAFNFETKEFLLVIWGDIVLQRIIDLLLTF